MPPSGSHSLRDNGADSRIESLAGISSVAEMEVHVLLAADMNATMGHLEDVTCAQGRGCTNTVVNTHGRQPISMCDASGGLLCIGRALGDESATLLYKPTTRSLGSHIDNIVVSKKLSAMMLACLVHTHRLESDHHPIERTLGLSVRHTQPQQCHGQPVLKRHWQPDLWADYSGNIGLQRLWDAVA